MGLAVVALAVALIPVGALVGAARDRSLRRRPRFERRFGVFLVLVTLPEVVVVIAATAGFVGDQVETLLLLSLFWGIALLPLASVLLFHGPGSDPGPSEDGGDDPDSGDDRPSPPLPLGGLPLPDAEQSSTRLRGPRPRRGFSVRRRPAPQRQPRRTPARLSWFRQPRGGRATFALSPA
jgi:hypothetical protein